MRFDDSLHTVLAADTSTRAGAEAMWRQLVDLIARGRAAADEAAIDLLRNLRGRVSSEVRTASARAVAHAAPPASLVALIAEDGLAVAAPVLRSAALAGSDWTWLMPRLSPALRAVLRGRRDLPQEGTDALAAFGSVDFVLSDGRSEEEKAAEAEVVPSPIADAVAAPLSRSPFLAVGDVARGLPLVAEAFRQQDGTAPTHAEAGSDIADLVRRIDAFNQQRGEPQADDLPMPATPGGAFRYATDVVGTIIWVDGVAREPLIGINVALGGGRAAAELDASVPGAFTRRARFADARLSLGGRSDAAGAWRLSGVPMFDRATGRFTGYQGAARRPRADEEAGPQNEGRRATSEALRQLVHELRTPANAIAGFAEMIDGQLLGPVSDAYREQAQAIRRHTAGLVAAIEDLDTAARIEGGALELRSGIVEVVGLIERVIADHAALAVLRGVHPTIKQSDPVSQLAADERAAERLIGRLLGTLIAAAAPGERLRVTIKQGDGHVALRFDRPAALQVDGESAMFMLDGAEEGEGAPLLGTGFALRLARNLAAEMGGTLTIDADRLTLRLPAVVDREVELATTP